METFLYACNILDNWVSFTFGEANSRMQVNSLQKIKRYKQGFGPFFKIYSKGEVFEGGGVNNEPKITTMTTKTTREVNRIALTTTHNKQSADFLRVDKTDIDFSSD